MDLFGGLEEICERDVLLGSLTSYKLGGSARWLLSPRDESELAAVLAQCREHRVWWRVLGRGANVLVNDGGVDGAVIRLVGPVWEEIRWDEPAVYAAGGVDFGRLEAQCAERGLAGLENLTGVPGTVGGMIRMNAGGKYGSMSEYVRAVRVMDEEGRVTTRSAEEVGFGYRHTSLGGSIVLGATFALRREEPEAIKARSQAIWKERGAAQPALCERTAGCVFQNPPGNSAGRLLDQVGLKGMRVGKAEISRKHANFIVADEGATARDVLELIVCAKERVRQSEGIELKLEVEIW